MERSALTKNPCRQSCSKNASADLMDISSGSTPASFNFSRSVTLIPGQYSIVITLSVVYWGYVFGTLIFRNRGESKFFLQTKREFEDTLSQRQIALHYSPEQITVVHFIQIVNLFIEKSLALFENRQPVPLGVSIQETTLRLEVHSIRKDCQLTQLPKINLK